MLNVYTLSLGDYETNCHIVSEDGKTCVVIDPGYDAFLIEDKLAQLSLQCKAILLTHGHFDHVGALRDLAATTGCAVYLRPEELTMPPQMTAGTLYYTDFYPDDRQLTVAGMQFTVLHTPGHTPGSVCLLTHDVLFSGDTLFAGSCGRTDFPGGNARQMTQSLRLLKTLPDALRVFPGHGQATTIAREKQHNFYFR